MDLVANGGFGENDSEENKRRACACILSFTQDEVAPYDCCLPEAMGAINVVWAHAQCRNLSPLATTETETATSTPEPETPDAPPTVQAHKVSFQSTVTFTTGNAADYTDAVGAAWTAALGTPCTAAVPIQDRRRLATQAYDVTATAATPEMANGIKTKTTDASVVTAFVAEINKADDLTADAGTAVSAPATVTVVSADRAKCNSQVKCDDGFVVDTTKYCAGFECAARDTTGDCCKDEDAKTSVAVLSMVVCAMLSVFAF